MCFSCLKTTNFWFPIPAISLRNLFLHGYKCHKYVLLIFSENDKFLNSYTGYKCHRREFDKSPKVTSICRQNALAKTYIHVAVASSLS